MYEKFNKGMWQASNTKVDSMAAEKLQIDMGCMVRLQNFIKTSDIKKGINYTLQ